MLNITILAVGDRMPTWIDQGFLEYQKRISRPFRLRLIEIPAFRRGKNADVEKIKQLEESKLLDSAPTSSYLIALDKRGIQWTTKQVARKMQNWLNEGDSVTLVIGGPDGFSGEFIRKCHVSWSLSDLTFPHGLARVIVAEQLYRGYSILQKFPYHR
ncbi:MAG: 23S rRNA (pseudouridine(1915)-N(3))-methyltransferase RlmH [Gammaproteobacteria bacterium]|nr:23S rRNA (pseudouridine(1915)-N(3))-methyltransferase RlmH [Gammaproteobacteria bacterium]